MISKTEAIMYDIERNNEEIYKTRHIMNMNINLICEIDIFSI